MKTVRQACRVAFEKSGRRFFGLDFVAYVRSLINRPFCMDGTILRELRQLREDGEFNFRCIDRKSSEYEKI